MSPTFVTPTSLWLSIYSCSDLPIAGDAPAPSGVDVEVTHDELGCPVLHGRRIQAQLKEAWHRLQPAHQEWDATADGLIGKPGVGSPVGTRLTIGHATVAPASREWIDWAVKRDQNPVAASDVLDAFTVIRRSTARDRTRGGSPRPMTLRSVRCLRSGQTLYAPLVLGVDTKSVHLCLLARLCLETRRIGLGRNRGLGLVSLDLVKGKDPLSAQSVLADFFNGVGPAASGKG